MTEKSKNILKLVLRVTVTSLLLVWVFNRIDMHRLGEAFKAARWQFLIAVWAVIGVIYWISSIKMRLILKEQGCNLSTARIFGISAVTAFYSMVMPGMLSMGMKWYMLRRSTGKGMNVFSSMAFNQLSNIVFMTMFGLGALILTSPVSVIRPNTQNVHLLPAVCGILLVILVLVCLLLLSKRSGDTIIKAFGVLLKPFPAGVRQKVLKVLENIALFQDAGWRFHLVMFLITIGGIAIGGVIMYMFAAKAANVSVPLSVFTWLWAVIFVLQRVPISIANLGVREAILSSVLPMYGVEPSAAVLMSVILFSALVFMALIGAIVNFGGFITGVRPDETV